MILLINAFLPTAYALTAKGESKTLLLCNSFGFQYIDIEEESPDASDDSVVHCPMCQVHFNAVALPLMSSGVLESFRIGHRFFWPKDPDVDSLVLFYAKHSPTRAPPVFG